MGRTIRMIKQYKLGLTCKKHKKCDIVNITEGVAICTFDHQYELYRSDHKYDLVFYTVNPSQYGVEIDDTNKV